MYLIHRLVYGQCHCHDSTEKVKGLHGDTCSNGYCADQKGSVGLDYLPTHSLFMELVPVHIDAPDRTSSLLNSSVLLDASVRHIQSS